MMHWHQTMRVKVAGSLKFNTKFKLEKLITYDFNKLIKSIEIPPRKR